MPALPAVGTRVSLRYRLPAGSVKPLTDVVGYLERLEPTVLVRTKSGELVDVAPADVVTVRELSHVPVRSSEIRALEHAAALAWPGTEQQWLGGWFLRAGGGATSRANSAVPLDVSAQIAGLPAVTDWYRDRGLPALLALPERLLPVRAAGLKPARVLARGLPVTPVPPPTPNVTLASGPDEQWLQIYARDVPLDVLTAVIDGELAFASVTDRSVGRGAVTTAPDGTRWLGVSSVRTVPEHHGQGHARTVCEALLNWGAQRGATRAYVQVEVGNDPAGTLYSALGFGLHHQTRYLPAGDLLATG